MVPYSWRRGGPLVLAGDRSAKGLIASSRGWIELELETYWCRRAEVNNLRVANPAMGLSNVDRRGKHYFGGTPLLTVQVQRQRNYA